MNHDSFNYNVNTNLTKYIYGDTDSVFFCFYLEDLEGNRILGKKALEITIEIKGGVCSRGEIHS